MKNLRAFCRVLLTALTLLGGGALAQTGDAGPAPPPSAPARRSAADLEKLVQPIALHPDPLVAIILPASAYPLEIVQAARFVKDTNNIAKLDQQPWDENVKAVARFPELIAKMDTDLQWTTELGREFVDQPKELMDAIQSLRATAQKAGTLQTTPQQVVVVTNVVVVQTNVTQVVTVTNQVIEVRPSNPEVIYVPTYPPTVYYPPPGYVYNPYAPLVTFGVGLAVGAIIANNCDWHGGGVWIGGGGMVVWGGGGGYGDVDIDIDNDINIDRDVNRGERPSPRSGDRAANSTRPSQQKWQPNQNRMQTSGANTAQTREARGWNTPQQRPATPAARPGLQPAGQPAAGASRPGLQPATSAQRPATAAGQRPATPATRPSTPSPAVGARPSPSPSAGARPTPSPSVNRPSPQPSTAFGGVSSGGNARNYGSRGAVSRGGGGGGRGGGRGR